MHINKLLIKKLLILYLNKLLLLLSLNNIKLSNHPKLQILYLLLFRILLLKYSKLILNSNLELILGFISSIFLKNMKINRNLHSYI